MLRKLAVTTACAAVLQEVSATPYDLSGAWNKLNEMKNKASNKLNELNEMKNKASNKLNEVKNKASEIHNEVNQQREKLQKHIDDGTKALNDLKASGNELASSAKDMPSAIFGGGSEDGQVAVEPAVPAHQTAGTVDLVGRVHMKINGLAYSLLTNEERESLEIQFADYLAKYTDPPMDPREISSMLAPGYPARCTVSTPDDPRYATNVDCLYKVHNQELFEKITTQLNLKGNLGDEKVKNLQMSMKSVVESAAEAVVTRGADPSKITFDAMTNQDTQLWTRLPTLRPDENGVTHLIKYAQKGQTQVEVSATQGFTPGEKVQFGDKENGDEEKGETVVKVDSGTEMTVDPPLHKNHQAGTIEQKEQEPHHEKSWFEKFLDWLRKVYKHHTAACNIGITVTVGGTGAAAVHAYNKRKKRAINLNVEGKRAEEKAPLVVPEPPAPPPSPPIILERVVVQPVPVVPVETAPAVVTAVSVDPRHYQYGAPPVQPFSVNMPATTYQAFR